MELIIQCHCYDKLVFKNIYDARRLYGVLDGYARLNKPMVLSEAVNRNGGNAKMTLFPNTEHDAWTPALSSDETWTWLLAQRK